MCEQIRFSGISIQIVEMKKITKRNQHLATEYLRQQFACWYHSDVSQRHNLHPAIFDNVLLHTTTGT